MVYSRLLLLRIKSSLHFITSMNNGAQQRRRPIRAHEAWMNSVVTSTETTVGGEPLRLFTLCTCIKGR
jgi:hypothetical protein